MSVGKQFGQHEYMVHLDTTVTWQTETWRETEEARERDREKERRRKRGIDAMTVTVTESRTKRQTER